jgi:homocysteine S-methyltransferase
METLIEAGVDVLAFETIPTVREAELLVDLLEEVGGNAWLSYTCLDDAHTAAGEPIEAAFAVGDAPGVVAVGVNCTAPRYVAALLAHAATVTDQPLIAYPNRGDCWDPVARCWVAEAGETYDPVTVAGWTTQGVGWLGGCCGTGPADIAALATAMGTRAT